MPVMPPADSTARWPRVLSVQYLMFIMVAPEVVQPSVGRRKRLPTKHKPSRTKWDRRFRLSTRRFQRFCDSPQHAIPLAAADPRLHHQTAERKLLAGQPIARPATA